MESLAWTIIDLLVDLPPHSNPPSRKTFICAGFSPTYIVRTKVEAMFALQKSNL
jgi:hypothetical protein